MFRPVFRGGGGPVAPWHCAKGPAPKGVQATAVIVVG